MNNGQGNMSKIEHSQDFLNINVKLIIYCPLGIIFMQQIASNQPDYVSKFYRNRFCKSMMS